MRKFYDDDEQRRFFEETWSRRRTDFKEVDNAFIMLEAFQNEAGGGSRAWLDRGPSCCVRGLAETADPGPG